LHDRTVRPSADHLEISRLKEDKTMLKTLSAALLAVSFIAAPALAAESAKDSVKTVQAPAAKTAVIKPVPTKPSVMNANAKMGGHHAKHHRHHRHHSKMSVLKTHSKIGFKQAAPATKRG
jgi:hypothetical protein